MRRRINHPRKTLITPVSFIKTSVSQGWTRIRYVNWLISNRTCPRSFIFSFSVAIHVRTKDAKHFPRNIIQYRKSLLFVVALAFYNMKLLIRLEVTSENTTSCSGVFKIKKKHRRASRIGGKCSFSQRN